MDASRDSCTYLPVRELCLYICISDRLTEKAEATTNWEGWCLCLQIVAENDVAVALLGCSCGF